MPTLNLLGIDTEVYNDSIGNVATVIRGVFQGTVREYTHEHQIMSGYGAHWELKLATPSSSIVLALGRTVDVAASVKALNNKAAEIARETIAIAGIR